MRQMLVTQRGQELQHLWSEFEVFFPASSFVSHSSGFTTNEPRPIQHLVAWRTRETEQKGSFLIPKVAFVTKHGRLVRGSISDLHMY